MEFIDLIKEIVVSAGARILLAIAAYFIGKLIISKIVKIVCKTPAVTAMEPTARSFAQSFVRILLYVILVISVISILGIPMTSVIAVLASAGVAVGLALQGALSNLAGGIMLMIFRPFNVGDFITAGGATGVVKEITLFYTTLITPQKASVMIPNGTLMNANVENFSTEPIRRVDMTFTCDRTEDFKKVQDIIRSVMEKNEKVLKDPAPFVSLSGATNEALEFAVRPFCAGADYGEVLFGLNQDITAALGEAGINPPKLRVVQEEK